MMPLSGLDVANASLYDGRHLVEAVNLAVVATGRPRVLCSQAVIPLAQQLETSHAFCNEIDTVPLSRAHLLNESSTRPFAAVVVAAPNFSAALRTLALPEPSPTTRSRLIVCFDPFRGLLRPPASLVPTWWWGGQPFGTALGFGGPYLGLFACRLAM